MNQDYPSPSNYPAQPAAPGQVWVESPVVRPVVTYTLAAITILVFLLQLGTQFLYQGVDIPALWGMKINEMIVQGQSWRLITPVFLHGSILHILFNMYALISFGPGLERYYGHGRFLALYFVSGFAGNVFSFMFSTAPSLGSSTAIFGLLGAEGVFLYQNRSLFGRKAQRALVNLITIAIVNLVIGMSPGIDNWGHIGGLIGGTLFAWLGGPVLEVDGVYPQLALTDRRQVSVAVGAGVGVFAVFALLAVLKIYLGG